MAVGYAIRVAVGVMEVQTVIARIQNQLVEALPGALLDHQVALVTQVVRSLMLWVSNTFFGSVLHNGTTRIP